MWLPVINDSSVATTDLQECVVEAILEVAPESALGGIDFVWLHDEPTDPPSDQRILSFRVDAEPQERLAAIVHDDSGLVLEVYLDNLRSALTDEWLERQWHIQPQGLRLSLSEKLEMTVFSLLAHRCMRSGNVEGTKDLIQRIGRIISRAAIRRVMHDLQTTYPQVPLLDQTVKPSRDASAPAAPISDADLAATNCDLLLRKLLGLTDLRP